ncbi:MAG: NUDIX hydrolase [Patescibacteria group bacterium]|nr:NUDIX hydrolase [Patescibacteria group bacterium]
MDTERLSPSELPKNKEIQKVVRGLVFSLASAEELYNSALSALGDEKRKNFPVLRFYLAVKGKGEDERYTFFGGKIEEGEKPAEAIQREIIEENNATPAVGTARKLDGQWRYSSPKSGDREVYLVHFAIIPPEKQLIIGDEKITGFKVLTLDQLNTLINTGSLGKIENQKGVPIEGHLALCDSELDPIEISPEEKKKREIALKGLLEKLSKVEKYLREKIILKMIFKKDGKVVSFEEFKESYEKFVSRIIRQGFGFVFKEKAQKKRLRTTQRTRTS